MEEKYKLTHTGSEVDSGVARALSGGEIDAALDSKAEIELLDNTDFTNPVAQAGIGGNHGSVAYAVDRWKLLSGTVSASSNGLTLNGTIRQIREFPIGFPVVPSIEMHSGTATITYDDTTKYCDIVSSGGVIKRPHLGLTAIADWSKVPKAEFAVELLKCQRFYRKYTNGIYVTCYSNGYLTGFLFPVRMRAVPVLTLSNILRVSDFTYKTAGPSSNAGIDGVIYFNVPAAVVGEYYRIDLVEVSADL